jgi:hypothetical protein
MLVDFAEHNRITGESMVERAVSIFGNACILLPQSILIQRGSFTAL